MCGIAGIVHFSGNPITQEKLKKMTDSIAHRGPDGEGFWISEDEKIGFGHRRLSIIDLSTNANQPMHFQDRYVICFNGEIYNYIELRNELKSIGYSFQTDSDTEVLLAMYAEYGEGCLKELDGMFALAIFDKSEQKLFLARDRFGEKPFYYYIDNDKLLFASEMKALWTYGIKKEIDPLKSEMFLNTGKYTEQTDLNQTFYKGIRTIPNAHFATFYLRDKDLNFSSYYNIDLSRDSSISLIEATEKFTFLFNQSIKRRLRSDVPIGSSLSGGLDSSAVVSAISDIKNKDQKQLVFSAKFPGFSKDESVYIDHILDHIGNIEDYFIVPTDRDLYEALEEMIHFQEEPIRSASIFAQWSVMKLAKENGVTVMLDGQGADEYLAGYIGYYDLYLKQLYYNDIKFYSGELTRVNALRGGRFPDMNQTETLKGKISRIKNKLTGTKIVSDNALKERLKLDSLNGNLLELLRYADRNAMAHQIETRLPFLYHELVDFVFTLPDEYLLNEGWTKYILRKSVESKIPASITWRVDKVGYEPPQSDWLSAKWVDDRIEKAGLVDYVRPSTSVNYTDDSRWRALLMSFYS